MEDDRNDLTKEETQPSFQSWVLQNTLLPVTKIAMRYHIQNPLELENRLKLLRQIEQLPIVKTFEDMHTQLPWSRATIERDQENSLSEWIKFKHTASPPPNTGLLYFHGGAFLVGTPSLARPITISLAEPVTAVLSAYYRKPPENPFPAPLEDALQAYSRIVEQVGDKIIIAGDSAGGCLALSTYLALKKNQSHHNLPLPIGILLFSPWLDITGETTRSLAEHDDTDHLLPLEGIPFMGGMYTSGQFKEADLDHLHAHNSPLHDNEFPELPPTLIQYGQNEALSADAKKLAEIGGPNVILDEIKGGWHSCHYFGRVLPEANQALERAKAFIRKTLPHVELA